MSRELQGMQTGVAAVVFAGAFSVIGLALGQIDEHAGAAGSSAAAEIRLAGIDHDLPLAGDDECSHDHDHDHSHDGDHDHDHDDC